MERKRKLNLYKGPKRGIKINSDIYLVRNVKERRSDEYLRRSISKPSTHSVIAIYDKENHGDDNGENKQSVDAGLSAVTKESIVKKTDDQKPITLKMASTTSFIYASSVLNTPTTNNTSVVNSDTDNKSTTKEVLNKLDTESAINLGKKKKILIKKPIKSPTTELLILDETLDEFRTSEFCSGQTQNERDALDSSSLFSLAEKRLLRINSYTPVLVDAMLLEKLVRLDKEMGKKLIFKVFKQLETTQLLNEEVLVSVMSSKPETHNNDQEFTAVVTNRDTKKQKKISIRKFLVNQLFNLLLSRLSRNKERPAEILFYLILKIAMKKQNESEVNNDLKRIKEKIQEYARKEKKKSENKKAKKAAGVYSDEGFVGKKKKKKIMKKKQKKTPVGIGAGIGGNLEAIEARIKTSRRTALANRLLKAKEGIVELDHKNDKQQYIKEYLTAHAHRRAPLLSDVAETSSSDLS